MLSDPPRWLRLAVLAIVLVALVQHVVGAHTVGDWLWTAAMAAAVVLLGAGLLADRKR
jgi:hypothetical protein